METLTDSGVTVETALREAAEVFHNAALRDATLSLSTKVSAGVPLSAGLTDSAVFPGRLAIWAAIGERTGNAAGVFSQLRVYYEEDVNRWVERFMTLIEPALIVVVGVAMLILVVTFVVPLFGVFGSVL
jgi:type II secretory pathway component PulF